MEKTAMQMLIDEMEVSIGRYKKHENDPMQKAYEDITKRATELRDTVEKEQIEGTYLTGYSERCREIMGEETFAKSSTDYYNKKYKP